MKNFRIMLAGALVACSVATGAMAVPAIYPNPGVEAPSTTFFAGTSGMLVGYFTGAAGAYTNLAGARINGVDGLTGLDNQASAYGTRFEFGLVNGGDSLAFFIDVLDTGERFYNEVSLNADGVNHMWAAGYAGDGLVPSGFNLAFEDLTGGGDFNYYDHSFVIGIERVPEPATLVLTLAGLGMAGVVARRRRQ